MSGLCMQASLLIMHPEPHSGPKWSVSYEAGGGSATQYAAIATRSLVVQSARAPPGTMATSSAQRRIIAKAEMKDEAILYSYTALAACSVLHAVRCVRAWYDCRLYSRTAVGWSASASIRGGSLMSGYSQASQMGVFEHIRDPSYSRTS